MRILFVHPNYRSGGAEIAGTWPQAWVAHLTGSLRRAGFDDIHFIDAMTNDIDDDDLARRMAEVAPDVVGVTAITPSIYKAVRVLEIARDTVPGALRMKGGVHPTFMHKQVLSEAPWVDVIVRGEGEEILTALMLAVEDGRWPADRHKIRGLAFHDGEEIVATHGAATIKDLDGLLGLVDPRLGEIQVHPVPDGMGLPTRPCQLGDVYAMAVHAAVSGTEGQGRGVRFFAQQFGDLHHETLRDGAVRMA